MLEVQIYSEEYIKYVEDLLLNLRKQFDSEEKYKEYIASIFLIRAYEIFGQMLDFLCEKSLISQRELGRRSTKYRKYLKDKGSLPPDSNTRAVEHSGISRVISVEKPPSYAQVYIWFHVLEEQFKSEEYAKKCEKMREPIFVFTQKLRTDMYRLALFGTPIEVIVAHEEYKDTAY